VKLPELPPPPPNPYRPASDDDPNPVLVDEADAPRVGFRPTPKQLKALDMLRSDATDIALGGGSRSGKTFLLVYCLVARAILHPGSRHAIFRFRLNALVRAVVYDTLPKVLDICYPGLRKRCHLDKVQWMFEFPNGSQIWFGGLDDKERTEKILGMEFATIYFNESSEIPYSSVVMAYSRLAQKVVTDGQLLPLRAYYDFNPPSKRHWTFKLFVERVDPDNPRKPLKDAHLYQFMYLNPADNAENLPVGYMRRLENMPARARNRFLLGKFADDSEGLLWDDAVLDATRHPSGRELPNWVRVIIAVDPSGCTGPADKRSDEVGIIVGALGMDGHAYVLEDLSGKYGPAEWSQIVSDAWERHSADCVVAESNFGGAMVEATITALGKKDINVKLITASRGKAVRAEPISALYARGDGGKVHHVGRFPELEQQMCDFTVHGYEGPLSPDRADALVWLLTELFPGIVKPRENPWEQEQHSAPRIITQPRSGSAYARRGR